MKKVGIVTLALLLGQLFPPLVTAQTLDTPIQEVTSSSQLIDSATEITTSMTTSSTEETTTTSTTTSETTNTSEEKTSETTVNTSPTTESNETPPAIPANPPQNKVSSTLNWQASSGYFSLANDTLLWLDETCQQPVTPLVGTTLKILAEAKETPEAQESLLKLSNFSGQIYYAQKNTSRISQDPFGIPTKTSGYAVISDATGVIWPTTTATTSLPVSDFLKTTLSIQAISHHYDGQIYYQVNLQEKTLGWLNQKALKETGPQGSFHSQNRYVQLTSESVIWSSFAFENRVNNQSYQQKPLKVKGEYYHANGKTYLSLYQRKNAKDSWVGYVEASQVTKLAGPQGNYQADGRYATITNGNYTLWQTFSWEKRALSKTYLGKTYRVKGLYRHYNGSTYLSLYDKNNHWLGYLNATGAALGNNPQGKWQQLNKYLTVTSNNYTLWQNFSWQTKQSSRNLKGQTYLVKGIYQHFNGSCYYSVYNNKNQWQGYLNATGGKLVSGKQGIWQSLNKKVILTSQNYTLWQNFSWQKKHQSSQYRSQLLTVKGFYQHYNGSRYYSMYQGNTWLGYINQTGTKNATSTASRLQQVQSLLNRKYKKANMGIYVTSLIDGKTAQVNGSQIFTAASTGKLPVLYYTQKLINEKKLNPNKTYRYTDQINNMSMAYMRGGAGILQSRPFGGYYSLDTIMKWTCQYSDNQGANFLAYYGANRYDQKMKNEISRVIGRKWERFRYISAKENALLLREMYHNGGQVLNYLSHTVYDSQRLPKYLPVRVAHKIGDLYGYAHDCGIVYTNQPYVISVMTNNAGYEIISQISKDVYQIMK